MKKENRSLKRTILFLFLLFIGGYSNIVVVTENGGKMPVLNFDEETEEHFGFKDASTIPYFALSDIFYYESEDFRVWYSLGDVVIVLASMLLILELLIMIYINTRCLEIKWRNQ